MKLRRYLTLLAMVAATFSGGLSSLREKTPLKTEAATIPPATVLYFQAEPYFYSSDFDHVSAYFWNDGGNSGYVEMTEIQINIYKVVAPLQSGASPADWTMLYFASFDTNGEKYTESPNLVWTGGKYNMYKLSTYSWVEYNESMVVISDTTPGINSGKVRIWVDRAGHYEYGYKYLLKVGIKYYQPTAYEKALVMGADGRYFPYYDLSLSELMASTAGTIDVVIVNDGAVIQESFTGTVYATGDNSKLWRIDNQDGISTNPLVFTKSKVQSRIYNTFFAKVLEGYLTCSNSGDNGYVAFGAFYNNLMAYTPANEHDMEGSLSDCTLKDFLSTDDYGTGIRESETSTNAESKLQRMRASYILLIITVRNIVN